MSASPRQQASSGHVQTLWMPVTAKLLLALTLLGMIR